MMVTWMNLTNLFALAIAGSALVMAARRIMRVIRTTERKLSRAVDEKNMVAAALRHAKREETAIRQALDEADHHISLMTSVIATAEGRIERLRAQPRRTVTMIDGEWQRFDRLWSVLVTNPALAAGRQSGGGWADGKRLYGFARSGDDLALRVGTQYRPGDGFIIGAPAIVDLTDDGGGSVAVDPSGRGA
ncbi:hypothetical protein [Niveispirillum fermenti]|uniref:hypothetical protein n=1 Tax=Niveispirillum fermenti TaxID=1233113 RepID=UPI003A868C62